MSAQSIGDAAGRVVNELAAKTGRVRQFPVDASLRREMEAAKTLLVGLHSLDGDVDPQLVADSIEGETNLREAIEEALSEVDEAEIMIRGLKAKEEEFRERRTRIEARSERLRALIEQALIISESETLRLPTATLSLRKVAPALVVDEEAEVPAEFFTPVPQPPPALDKKSLRAALDAGRSVPGAHLGNGGVALTVRRK